MKRYAGFTLIEVLVALFIVGLSMGALMATLTQAATHNAMLRDQAFAQWIALNRVTEVRLNSGNVVEGKIKGTVEFAGQKWRWRQQIADSGISSLMSVTVGVSLASEAEPSDSSDVLDGSLGSAAGFIGRALGPRSGTLPDWGPTT